MKTFETFEQNLQFRKLHNRLLAFGWFLIMLTGCWKLIYGLVTCHVEGNKQFGLVWGKIVTDFCRQIALDWALAFAPTSCFELVDCKVSLVSCTIFLFSFPKPTPLDQGFSHNSRTNHAPQLNFQISLSTFSSIPFNTLFSIVDNNDGFSNEALAMRL